MTPQSEILVRGSLVPEFAVCSLELRYILEHIMQVLGLQGRVELQCAGDKTIAALNESFLGCVGPTNILSFPSEEEDVLGELVLGREALLRECVFYGQDMHEHLVRLLAHGLLHLAGFEHGEPMYSLTEQAVHAFSL